MIQYMSTRGSKETKSAAQAIIQGIAKDKGLYVPNQLPAFNKPISQLIGKNYQSIAYEVMSQYLSDFTEDELKDAVNKAYDEKFEKDEIVPIVNRGGAHFLELYHGKTAAFKDMALSILPHLLTKSLKKEKEDKKIVILTATSGDTGKAALEGFADVPSTEIIVFYPVDGVSEVQKRQMVTQEGNNTHVIAIKGNFDDAQSGVKKIFNDGQFNDALNQEGFMLSSANSINIGRLIPQIAYYVYAYVKLIENGTIKEGDKMNVVVPTGNFGNILAAYYASQMGIPVNKFICASNKNKVLTDFINTGIYDTNRDFYVTNSPSMDILISSNLERLLYHVGGCDPEIITNLMGQLESEKRYELPQFMKEKMDSFIGGFADETQTLSTIKALYESENYLIDTHTAVAYYVYLKYREKTGDDTPTVIASTASPYKFANNVITAVSQDIEGTEFELVEKLNNKTNVSIPQGLKHLDQKQVRHNAVIEKDQMMNAIKNSLV